MSRLHTMKRYVIDTLSKINAVRAYFAGYCTILMLHRIAPINPSGILSNEKLKVSPEFLESFIKCAKNKGFGFISLDELHSALTRGTLAKKTLCITCDDGYKDNLTYGYPVFKAQGVPFAIYISTTLPQNAHDMWWFGLEDYLLSRQSVDLPNGGGHLLDNAERKDAAFLALRNIIIAQSSSYTDAQHIAKKLGIIYNPRKYDNLALSWEDIAFLHNDNLATIGNHTHSHPIFNAISDDEIIADITKAQDLFQAHGIAPRHFAYPFGSRIEVSAKHFEIPKKLGFATATTTRHGSIFPAHKAHLCALPRVMIYDDFVLESAFKIRKKRIVTT